MFVPYATRHSLPQAGRQSLQRNLPSHLTHERVVMQLQSEMHHAHAVREGDSRYRWTALDNSGQSNCLIRGRAYAISQFPKTSKNSGKGNWGRRLDTHCGLLRTRHGWKKFRHTLINIGIPPF